VNYYVLERANSSRYLYLPNEGVTRATIANGVSPATVRAVFDEAFGNGQACLDLVTVDGTSVDLTDPELPDLFYWSWVPAFSERAQRLMLELGSIPSDFSHCQIGPNPDRFCFLHLPVKTYDLIDMVRSRFKYAIPTIPPVPFGLQQMTMKCGVESMPHCFRNEIPGTPQVLAELVVSEEFRDRWVSKQLVGANFRCVAPESKSSFIS
jgi:hypothetical protein